MDRRPAHRRRKRPPARPSGSTPPGTTRPRRDLIEYLTEDCRVSYTDLARRIGVSALTAHRRLDTLVAGNIIRLATELDLALLGAHVEAFLWINVQPGALEETATALTTHPQVRFVSATTGPANLLVAVAATDLNAVYTFLISTIGPLTGITSIETTPLLATAKRTGLIRRSSLTLS